MTWPSTVALYLVFRVSVIDLWPGIIRRMDRVLSSCYLRRVDSSLPTLKIIHEMTAFYLGSKLLNFSKCLENFCQGSKLSSPPNLLIPAYFQIKDYDKCQCIFQVIVIQFVSWIDKALGKTRFYDFFLSSEIWEAVAQRNMCYILKG